MEGAMMDYGLLMAVLSGILLLFLLILKGRLPPFIALLIASIYTGFLTGMEPQEIIKTIQAGMGSTLGFVAVVIGLGGVLGGILQHTGGAQALAEFILEKTGERRAPWAMVITGLLVGIPVFFDVGFIVLFPLIVAVHQKTGKSVIHYAVPLLAGLAVSHAFIPPTPGPLAVADILQVSLAWMILVGLIVGIPSALVSGILYGRFLGDRLMIELPNEPTVAARSGTMERDPLLVGKALLIILLPLVLMVTGNFLENKLISTGNQQWNACLQMFCHPFSALIIANLLAWYLLGRMGGWSRDQLSEITVKSLYPVGLIILVTGAGGVYKEMLISTGAGAMIATALKQVGLDVFLFAFVATATVRILQGSATVAMITGAGLVAPLLPHYELTEIQLASVAICIASAATIASHLNDSGFWLPKEYLRLTEKQGIQTWTVASTILSLTGFLLSGLIFYLSPLI
jgi:Gnt-I system low-affinity gluconate transporter